MSVENNINSDEQTILLIDDEIINLKLLTHLLSKKGYSVRPAERPQMAIDYALAHPPDLIILDIVMPGMDGFEVCRKLKANKVTRDVPIIFVSGLNSVAEKLKGFEAGGVDFISKPFQEPEVLARVKNHLQLHGMKVHLEDMVEERTQVLSRVNKALTKEIAERKLAENQLRQSEEKYRNLVDNAIVGVFHSRIDGGLVYANQALASMYEFDSPQEMIERKALGLWGGPEQWVRMLDKLYNHGRVSNFEAALYSKKGRKIHILLSATLEGSDIAGMVMDITQKKETEEKIIQYQGRLKALASQLTLVEEKERRRIAEDLHDHIGQTLAFSRIQVAKAKKLTRDDKLSEILEELSQSLLSTIRDTKELVFDLSSPLLNEIGLGSAISSWLNDQMTIKHGIRNRYSGPDEKIVLGHNVSTILFRNIRELLTNIVRHARAKMVTVKMQQVAGQLQLIVTDDGIGFDPEKINNSEGLGFGLFSIRERMADYGGELDIKSTPGKGCRVVLSIPINRHPNNKTERI